MICGRTGCLNEWRNRGRLVEKAQASTFGDAGSSLGHIRQGRGSLLNVEVDRGWEEPRRHQLALT